jgi:CBS domain-containing protein
MNVASMLKSKGRSVVSASAETTVLEIARMLRENRVGCVVIVDGGGKLAGIVSERDVVRAIGADGAAMLDQPVSRCMTREVVTCRECDTIEELMAAMTAHRFRHMPVVERGKLIGLISIGDVVKMRIAETEMETAAMREYIATG